MKKLHVLALAILALLAAPITSFAQAAAWTSPGSAGATLDETSLGSYAVNPPNNTCLTIKSNIVAARTIQARYDVVNTAVPSTPLPPWNTFELGFVAPPPSTVIATLYRVFPCTGQRVQICQVVGDNSPNPTCRRCTFAPSFNYITELYMVEVTLTKPEGAPPPQVCTLRVFN